MATSSAAMGNLGLAEMQIALASGFASFNLESSPH
ncbi:hypothetical protein COLO4_25398 [Corchorus olitorius]|uniref:Uncharacterized protein n=1 Tax=Corchorus olitorius TaxID=93759 RepID=A0A1R3I3E2_9ROSI|nr:hypothetical protein COLO4_25398 [Corchorus olitorius]